MPFYSESDLKSKQLLEGITLKAVSGESSMLTIFDLAPGAVIPPHKHIHEQITYVIAGELELTVEGQTRVLRSGDGAVILSNQDHSAKVLSKPTKAVDAWHPIREDYL